MIGAIGVSSKDLEKLDNIPRQVDVEIPECFMRFMTDQDLQSRIHSCCYLELPDRVVKTIGKHEGYLIHFLSDQQYCCHWYIYISRESKHYVVVSPYPYGVNEGIEDNEYGYPTSRLNEIDLEKGALWLCAESFSEFIYRFWLENKICLTLYEEKSLSKEMEEYIDKYPKAKRSNGDGSDVEIDVYDEDL